MLLLRFYTQTIQQLPEINFGTYQLAGDDCYRAVRTAIDAGYRGIDTASIYRNEEVVGKAIKDSGKRNDIFITTKLSPMETGLEVAYQAFNACLGRLGVAHVDMLLIHWPGKAKVATDSPENRRARKQTWEALERIHQEGRARFIGVSNFTETHLTQLFEDGAKIKPYANQVEVHVLLQQRSLREFCKSHGILLQCYSPLGSGGAPVITPSKAK